MKKCVAPYSAHWSGIQNGAESLTAHEPRLRQLIAGTIQGLNVAPQLQWTRLFRLVNTDVAAPPEESARSKLTPTLFPSSATRSTRCRADHSPTIPMDGQAALEQNHPLQPAARPACSLQKAPPSQHLG